MKTQLKNKKRESNIIKGLITMLLFSICFIQQAQVLGTYSFTGYDGCAANDINSQPANASFSRFTSSGTSCAFLVSNEFKRKNWNTSTSINTSEYNTFTISASGGNKLNLTNLSFKQVMSSNNSSNWVLRSSLDNYAANIATGSANTSTQNVSINLPSGFLNIDAVTFRLYILDANSSYTYWTNDEVVLSGTVSPACTNPVAPAVPTSNSPQCSSIGVTIVASGTAPVGVTWYWQGTNANGTSTSQPVSSPFFASVSGTYYVRAKANAGNCWSSTSSGLAVLVNSSPEIFLSASTEVCLGSTDASLSYSSTTGSPDKYSIDYDLSAEASGFVDVMDADLSASPIPLIISNSAVAGTYNFSVSVKNTSSGCSSTPTMHTLSIKIPATVEAGNVIVTDQSSSPSAITLVGASIGGSATTAAWSIISGGGSLSSNAQTATPSSVTYTPAANYSGSAILRLTSESSICPAATDDRIIVINKASIQEFNASSTFTVPEGVTSVTVECWGGGGGGGGNGLLSDAGGGGGGGAYSKATIAVVPGSVYPVNVGNGGAGGNLSGNDGNDGADSWFINSSTILAKGGEKGKKASSYLIIFTSPGDGGNGGPAGSGIGAVKYSGGNGAKGSGGIIGAGGGGGSSAGDSSNGSNANNNNGGNAPSGGGDGGNGYYLGFGDNGKNPGGGGAGGSFGTFGNGGNGGKGKVKISWMSPSIVLTSAVGTDNQTVDLEPITEITYLVTGGATGAIVTGLPAGFTWNFDAGIVTINGTPTVYGVINYTVSTVGGGAVATAEGTINVKSCIPDYTLETKEPCYGESNGSITLKGFSWDNNKEDHDCPGTVYSCDDGDALIDVGTSVSVGFGQVKRLTGSFSGSIHVDGGTLIICASASVDGLFLKNNATVIVTGSLLLNNPLTIPPGSRLINNSGSISFASSLAVDGWFFNLAGNSSLSGSLLNPIGKIFNSANFYIKGSPFNHNFTWTNPPYGCSDISHTKKCICSSCPGTVNSCLDGDELIGVGAEINVGLGQIKRLTSDFSGSIRVDGGTLIICASANASLVNLLNGGSIIVNGSLQVSTPVTIPIGSKIINNSGNITLSNSFTANGMFFNLGGTTSLTASLFNPLNHIFNSSIFNIGSGSFGTNFDPSDHTSCTDHHDCVCNEEACTITWTGTSQTGPVLTNLPSGTYVATFNCNNCEREETIVLGEPSAPLGITVNKVTNSDKTCNGEIDLIATGGTAPYVYKIDHIEKTPPFTNLCIGFHKVKVIDNNGCSVEEIIEIDTSEIACCPGLSEIKITQPECATNNGKLELIVATDTCGSPWYDGGIFGHGLTEICDNVLDPPSVTCADSTRGISILNHIIDIGEIVCIKDSYIGDITMRGGTLVIGAGAKCIIDKLDFSSGKICFNTDVVVNKIFNCSGPGDRTLEIHGDVKLLEGNFYGSISNYHTLSIGGDCFIPYGGFLTCKGDFDIHGNLINKGTINKHNGHLSHGLKIFGDCLNDKTGIINNFCKFIVEGKYTEWGIRHDHDPLWWSKCKPKLPQPKCTVVWKDLSGNELGNEMLLENLAAGFYVSEVTCDNKCVKRDTLDLTFPNNSPSLVITIEEVTNSDLDECNGSATISVTGGLPKYAYEWKGTNQTNPKAEGLCSGNYFVVVTDANGCSTTKDVPIPPNGSGCFDVTHTETKPSCNEKADGAIDLTINPVPTSGLTFNWSNGAVTEDISSLSPKIYVVNISSTVPACKITKSYNLLPAGKCCPNADPTICCDANAKLYLNEDSPALCATICDGQVTATATGITPVKYIWGDIETTSNTWDEACPKKYTVTAIDANNCFAEKDIYVGEKNECCTDCSLAANALSISLSSTTASAATTCTGTATVLVTGGTGAYTFDWVGTGQTTNTANGLCAGNYLLIVKDANCCTQKLNVEIGIDNPNDPCELTIDEENSQPCEAFTADGSIVLNIKTKCIPSFEWNTGATTKDIFDLMPGVYSVTVTVTSKKIVKTFELEESNDCCPRPDLDCPVFDPVCNPNASIEVLSVVNTDCPDKCVGKIEIKVNGILAPRYVFGGIETDTTVFDVACNKTYLVSAISTLNKKCAVSTFIEVGTDKPDCQDCSQDPLKVAVLVNGFDATPIVSGGFGQYEFLWSKIGGGSVPNPTNANQVGLPAGTYQLIVTSKILDCGSDTLIIELPNCGFGSISTTILQQPTQGEFCLSNCDGQVELIMPSFDSNTMEITWNNNELVKGKFLMNACPGTHFAEVSEAGCIVRESVTLEDDSDCPPPVCTLSTTVVSKVDRQCFDSEGFIDIDVTGSTDPLIYQWETPYGNYLSNSEDLRNALPGTYVFTAISSRDTTCRSSELLTVTGPLTNLTSSLEIIQPTCAGGTGAVTISIQGGVPPYTVTWFDIPENFQTRSNLSPGYYFATITDANDCSTNEIFQIEEPDFSGKIYFSRNKICSEDSVRLTARRVNGYSVEWTLPSGKVISNKRRIISSQTGTYTLTYENIEDACGPVVLVQTIMATDSCLPTTDKCPPKSFVVEEPEDALPPCVYQQLNAAETEALERYEEYISILKRNFKQEYVNTILNNTQETFSMEYAEKTYQTTLYYYDQADNLVRTVMPSGVNALTEDQTADAVSEMEENKPFKTFTDHTLASTYKYNSTDQLVALNVPDHNRQAIWETTPSTISLNGALPIDASYNGTDNGILIANTADQARIYTSDDTGVNWVESMDLGLGDIQDIFKLDNSNVFAVGNSGTFIKSEDNGASWIIRAFPTTDDLFRLQFTSLTDGIVIAADGGIFTTSDGGQTWSSKSSSLIGVKTGTVTDVSFGPSAYYATTSGGGAGHVYRSTNQGTTWQEEFFTAGTLKDIIFDGSVFLAAGPPTALFKQDGVSGPFEIIQTSLNASIKKIVKETGYAAVSTSNELYQGNGAGTSWTLKTLSNAQNVINKGAQNIAYSTTQISQDPFNVNLTPAAIGGTTISIMRYLDNVVALTTANGKVLIMDASLNMSTTDSWSELTISGGPASTVIDAWHSSNVNNWVLLYSNGNVYDATKSGNTLTVGSIQITGISEFISLDDSELFAINNSTDLISRTSNTTTWTSVTNLPADASTLSGIALKTVSAVVKGAAVFNNGTLYEFASNSWTNRTNTKAAGLNAVDQNGSNFYAVGDNSELYKRIGSQWTFQSFINTGLTFNDVNISTDNTVRVASQSNVYTYSGGALNSVLTGNISRLDNNINTVLAISQNGNVYSNAGGPFVNEYTATSNLFAVASPNLVGGVDALIYRDNGGTWEATASPAFQPLTELDVDGDNSVVVGVEGTLATSDDNGATWSAQYTNTAVDITSVAINGSTIYAGTGNGLILRSQNNWAATSLGTAVSVNSIALKDATILLAASANNLFKSTNSGNSFTTELTAADQLNSVYVDEDGYGFVVGNSGLAYRITPTGANDFSYELIGTDGDLNDELGSGLPIEDFTSVEFTDRSVGYIAAENGQLLKTVDGGFHWSTQDSGNGTSSPIIALGNAREGTLITSNGTVNMLIDQSLLYSSRNWYDEVTRLVLSQNSKQFSIENYLSDTEIMAVPGTGTIRAYAYTYYDEIDRIIEVGELLTREQVPTYKYENQIQYSGLANFILTGIRREITHTFYDVAILPNVLPGFVQENLRPRVSTVAYLNSLTDPNYRATFYSYDIHGNVKSLVQEIIVDGVNIKKKIDYEYDLISGNVNNFYYQKGEADQLIHHFQYDGDNRLISTATSRDGIIWDKDVEYQYYAHGPLARTIIGDKKIEQIETSYTLQSWIKEMQGQAFSYALGYYNEGGLVDYQPIDGGVPNLNTPIADMSSLYNGNISSIASNTPKFEELGRAVDLKMNYRYDQLNRLTASNSVNPDGADAASFATTYAYDGGGNLTRLQRYDSVGNQFDDLTYILQNISNGYDRNTNKLRNVEDLIDAGESFVDIDDQLEGNYNYDDIGNTIKDTQEEIANIEWNVFGKIVRITRENGSTLPDLEFAYDGLGNRIAKTIKVPGGDINTTYYIRDAEGQLLSVYNSENNEDPQLIEQVLYGNSRLGNLRVENGLVEGVRRLGAKAYELKDVMDNVRFTFSDLGNGINATDYYAFGSPMPSRNWISDNYRFGFNGHEKDDEIKGFGNHLSFGDYGYDTRLGRRWNVDPVETVGLSGYVAFKNNPNFFTDPDGESPMSILAKMAAKSGIKKAAKELVEQQIKARLKKYMSKSWAKQLGEDALTAIDLATSQAWWEYALEVVPIVGDAYGGVKLTEAGVKIYKIVERFENRAAAIVKGLKGGSTALGKAIKGGVKKGFHAHHIIPEQLLKENAVVQDAVAAGFKFTDDINGIAVRAFNKAKGTGSHANHPSYTEQIRGALDKWARDNEGFTPQDAKKFLEGFAKKLKKKIEKESVKGGKKINDLRL